MGYTYTPTYYSGLHDTIASLCKSILPFGGFRSGRRLTADQAAARRHADALKWQQESFHRILHLSALHREGIVPPSDVDAFRADMLATLAAAPPRPPTPTSPPSSATSSSSSRSSCTPSASRRRSTTPPRAHSCSASRRSVSWSTAPTRTSAMAARLRRRHQPRRLPWRSGRRSTSGTRRPPRRPPTSRSTRPSSRHGRAEARRSWTHRGHR
ncbi:hypothetical protein EE612_049427 [Oryza sativa]|nr:hypothetical protein EE612_049427 [Oryza sativa]